VRPPGAFSVALLSAFRHWSIDRHDISVRSSRQKKKLADSEPASSSLFLLRCSTHINRYSKKSNPLAGWLNGEAGSESASFFFCRRLLTEMSCRYIGTCRNADTTATLSVTAQSASLGFAVWCGTRARASAAASAFFSCQLILPGLRPGNPQRLAASSNSNLELIGGELIFARRRRLW
jgi:hypothetical protein